MSVQNRLLSIQELADFLKLTPATIHRYLNQGLPSIRVSPKRGVPHRFDLDTVMRWIARKYDESLQRPKRARRRA